MKCMVAFHSALRGLSCELFMANWTLSIAMEGYHVLPTRQLLGGDDQTAPFCSSPSICSLSKPLIVDLPSLHKLTCHIDGTNSRFPPLEHPQTLPKTASEGTYGHLTTWTLCLLFKVERCEVAGVDHHLTKGDAIFVPALPFHVQAFLTASPRRCSSGVQLYLAQE
jgi:hypothetical protein